MLAAHPEVKAIRIEGHTDAHGPAALNTRLSQHRSEAVRAWLVKQGGISPERLAAAGFGPARPVADNATDKGRQENRRMG